jgi:hypothetical protein
MNFARKLLQSLHVHPANCCTLPDVPELDSRITASFLRNVGGGGGEVAVGGWSLGEGHTIRR